MWLSFALMSRDMEMSCDESVLRRMGQDAKVGYSSSLLSLSVKRSGLFAVNPLAFSESNVKARIKNILDYKKPAFWLVFVSVVVVIGVGIAMISNPNVVDLSSKSPDTSEIPHNDPSNIVSQQKEQEEIQNKTPSTDAGDSPQDQHSSTFNEENEEQEEIKNEIPLTDAEGDQQDQHSSTFDEENVGTLLSQPIEDKVCLGIFPTEQFRRELYYVLNDEAQQKLIPMLNNLEKK